MSARLSALNHKVIKDIQALLTVSGLTVILNKGRAICQACFVFMFVFFVSFIPLCARLTFNLFTLLVIIANESELQD